MGSSKRKSHSKSRDDSDSDSDPHPAEELIVQKFASRAAQKDTEVTKPEDAPDSSPAETVSTRKRQLDTQPKPHSAPAAKRPRKPFGVTIIDDDDPAPERSAVLQSLLRLPRYFDADFDGSGQKCFRCGQPGHMSHSCPNEARKKPCCICANFDHGDRDCPHRQRPDMTCFKCGRPGHLARDCRHAADVAAASGEPCLRCGRLECSGAGFGENYRFCQQEYTAEDMQRVLCISCGSTGHLNCKPMKVKVPKPSCAICSESGHLADECWKNRQGVAPMLPTRASASAYSYGNGHEAAAQAPMGRNLHARLSAPPAIPAHNAHDRWQMDMHAYGTGGQQMYGSPQYHDQRSYQQQPYQYQQQSYERHQQMQAHATHAARMLGGRLPPQYGSYPQHRVYPY